MKNTITSQENETVAAICYRYYGYSQGVTEAVFNANSHLAQYGAALPAGVKLNMPIPPAITAIETVTLWS